MPRPSLLACFAHPDDEAFSCSGTLAAAAAGGFDVTVICATRGERGAAGDNLEPNDLAARRSEELVRSCRVLGAGPPRFLDLADGELAAHREPLRARLEEVLADIPADAVITMGPDGAYGHLDHVVCSAVLTEAVAAAGAAPTVLYTVFPPGLFEPLRRKLRRAPIPLAPDGARVPSADYVVDIRPFQRHKLASIGSHRSQLQDGDPRSFLMPGIVDRLLDEELFRHAGGPALDRPLVELFTSR